VQPTPKAGNKPWQHGIVHGLDKPGVCTTDSHGPRKSWRQKKTFSCRSRIALIIIAIAVLP
jgi:hypothetical protein